MAVLFAEGFTGIARGTYTAMATTNPMLSLGWAVRVMYNGGNVVAVNDNTHWSIIAADPIFADRNTGTLRSQMGTGGSSYSHQWKMPVDTSGYSKFVIGMVFQVDNTTATTNRIQFMVTGPTLSGNTVTGFPTNEMFAQFFIPDNGADGTISSLGSAESAANSAIKKGKVSHVEVFIEEDVDRVRVYLDGNLVSDATYTGTFASTSGGFSVALRTANTFSSTMSATVSNMYLLGCDTKHTGPLGPATRVLESAPKTDVDVHFDRTDGFASNAAVLAQYFDSSSSGMLTAGDAGTYDIYNSLDAVAANAAQVYGAGLRVYAMSMAEGEHALKPAIKNAGGVVETGKEAVLALGVAKSFFMDMSVNPATSAIWTPAQLRDVGFGIKLTR